MAKLLFRLCYSPTACVRLLIRPEMVAADYRISFIQRLTEEILEALHFLGHPFWST